MEDLPDCETVQDIMPEAMSGSESECDTSSSSSSRGHTGPIADINLSSVAVRNFNKNHI